MPRTLRRICVVLAMICSTALLADTVLGQARWIRLAPFPDPSEELYGVAVNGKMFVLGGLGARMGMVYEYDPATDAWTKKKPMPIPTHHQSMVEYRGKMAPSTWIPRVEATMTQAEAPSLDVGPLNSDRRHALVGSGSVLLPYDVQLGGVFTFRSAMPFSATSGIDINGDAANTDYVPGTTRTAFNRGNNEALLKFVNAWRTLQGPDGLHPGGLQPIALSQIDTNEFFSLDLRASKSIQLRNQRVELIAQVFNILGRVNLVAVPGGNTLPSAWTTNALSDQFGRIVNAGNMRQAELAVRYVW